ncbi:CDP-diacylglycerol--glycerol-3-phosphate 3-phosphatidyltransferase [Christensenella timonensis]|uniref:CDP-diacylglycerol--glycerol-3-phosphate 3-phosphatidyltransferase n=1 Tax=Christensenella timonensis TaxID=1816678 RepID=UPI00082ABB81|nr:CDP-diacylglycerol--glycerol-3-phosphate 3-phosphatidyltransferase [Christensenella timonensis]
MKWNAPNILTLARMVLIPFFVLFYFVNVPDWNIYAAIIFIAAAFTDWLDGFLARRNNQVSNFGKLWDPIADKLLVLAALLLLMDWGKVGLIPVLIIEARELIIGGVRSLAASKGVVIAADMSGKLKTVVQFVAIILLLLNDWPFMFVPVSVGSILIWVSAALAVYSCIEYMVKNAKVLKD